MVVVDDHSLFRAGVIAELSDRVQTVGEAADVAEAIAVIARTSPDVVLLDVHLPGGGGAAVIKGSTHVPTRFLAVSVSDSAEDVIGLVRAGARGYVTKNIAADDLADAVVRVAEGDAFFSPRLAGFVLDAFGPGSPSHETAAASEGSVDVIDAASADESLGSTIRAGEGAIPLAGSDGAHVSAADVDHLTAREREVMRYLARGYSYKEIGQALHISVKTVETHASAVLRKLQMSSRHQLTHWAADNKLL